MGNVDRTLPPTYFWNPNTRPGSSVGRMSALYANSPNIEPRVRLSWSFPSYAKQVVSYWPIEWTLDTSKLLTKDLHRNSVDCPDMVPAAYRGRKAKNLNIKEIKTSSINHHYPFNTFSHCRLG